MSMLPIKHKIILYPLDKDMSDEKIKMHKDKWHT